MSLELEGSPRGRQARGRSRAFLLRCWQEPDRGKGGAPAWRFSLTHINAKRERKGFASLEAMMAYLRQALELENGTISKGEQS